MTFSKRSKKGTKKKEEKELESGERLADKYYCIADELIENHSDLFPKVRQCGSSDAMDIYEKYDEDTDEVYYDAHCWSCSQVFSKKMVALSSHAEELGVSEDGSVAEKKTFQKRPKAEPLTKEEAKTFMKQIGFKGHDYRGISDEVCKFYGHLTKVNNQGEVVARFYPETDDTGNIVGFKCRNHPKDFRYGKLGLTGATNQLSGQVRWRKGVGKYCLVVGGEEDKAAALQMFLEYNRSRGMDDYDPFPVVSPTTGEGSAYKQLAAQYDWLDTFDSIYLALDSDKAGREALERCIEVLPAEKVYIVTWSGKDPNEMLQKGKQKQFIRDFYNAKPYVPDNVKTSKDADDEMEIEISRPKIPLPPFMRKLQDLMAGGIPLGYLINLGAQTGGGKCLGKGTPILMHDMTTKGVEDVKVGDLLMGDDGSPRKVKSVCTGRENLYKVKQNRGMDYIVNESHILSLRASYSKKTFNKGVVYDVPLTDYISFADTDKHVLKGYVGSFRELGKGKKVRDPYAVGLWLADGTSAKSQVTISKEEEDLIDWIYSWSSSKGYSLNISPSNDRKGCITYDISGGFYSQLKSLKLINNKHIPKLYLTSCYEDRVELLSGILDGDGHLHNNGYDITLKNDQLAKDVLRLAISLGFRTSSRVCNKGCQGGFVGEYLRINIAGDVTKLRLKNRHKQGVSRKDNRTGTNTGLVIEPLGKGDYYGFEIDGNRRFCLQDGTVTHNTTIANEMIYYWVFNCPYRVGILTLELNAGQYQTTMLSRHIGHKIHLIEDPEEALSFVTQPWVKEKRVELREQEDGQPRYVLLDGRDGTLEDVRIQIDKLIKKYECKFIIIDPINDLFEGVAIEEQTAFVKYLKSVLTAGISILNVCHITKGETRTDRNGNILMRRLTEDDFAGVSNIAKSGGCNILASRNKLSDNPVVKNTTIIDVPKCRWTGRSGRGGEWYYEMETHTIHDYETFFGEPYTEESASSVSSPVKNLNKPKKPSLPKTESEEDENPFDKGDED